MLVIYLFLLYLVLSTSFNIFLFLHFNGHMASSSRVLSLTFCWYSYLCISPFLYGYVLVFLFSFGTASVLVRLLPGCTNFCHYQCVNWQSTSPFFPKEKNTSTLLLLYMVICKHQSSNGKQSVLRQFLLHCLFPSARAICSFFNSTFGSTLLVLTACCMKGDCSRNFHDHLHQILINS